MKNIIMKNTTRKSVEAVKREREYSLLNEEKIDNNKKVNKISKNSNNKLCIKSA